ncbi:MAG: hypothetical protein GY850_45195 [bacterium]|nr:hypothetical protein [bacterium]
MRSIIIILALWPAFALAGTYLETRNLEMPVGGLHLLKARCGAGSLTLRGVEGTDRIKVTAEIESEGTDKEEFQLLVDKLIQLDLRREYDEALLISNTANPPLTNIESRIHLTLQLPVNLNAEIIIGTMTIAITSGL